MNILLKKSRPDFPSEFPHNARLVGIRCLGREADRSNQENQIWREKLSGEYAKREGRSLPVSKNQENEKR